MQYDEAAHAELTRVAAEWTEAGVLQPLHTLVGDVWRTNLARYEPELGDDAVSIGVQSSRNLANRAADLLRPIPDVGVRATPTLEVSFGGRILHAGKAPSEATGWDVHGIDWTTSGIRLDGAAANARAYVPIAGTLLEELGPVPGQPVDPGRLRHLHLTWQGLPDGLTRTWLGFPVLGDVPWFAVLRLDDAAPAVRAAPTGGGDRNFDALGAPDPAIRPRAGALPA